MSTEETRPCLHCLVGDTINKFTTDERAAGRDVDDGDVCHALVQVLVDVLTPSDDDEKFSTGKARVAMLMLAMPGMVTRRFQTLSKAKGMSAPKPAHPGGLH